LFFHCWTYISIHISSANICGKLKNKLNNCVCALLRQYQKFTLTVLSMGSMGSSVMWMALSFYTNMIIPHIMPIKFPCDYPWLCLINLRDNFTFYKKVCRLIVYSIILQRFIHINLLDYSLQELHAHLNGSLSTKTLRELYDIQKPHSDSGSATWNIWEAVIEHGQKRTLEE
jgi:hypothetical protein